MISIANNLQAKLGHFTCENALATLFIYAGVGVRSVSIQGQNDQLYTVIGEGIDTAKLTRELRKKVCHTTIVTIQAAPPPPPPPQQQKQPPQPHLPTVC